VRNFCQICEAAALSGWIHTAPYELCHTGQRCLSALLSGARQLHSQAIPVVATIEQRVAKTDEGFRRLARLGVFAQRLKSRNGGKNRDCVAFAKPRGATERIGPC
jgi:hypothetical protein